MTRDPRAWMWAEACEFLDRADRLQRQFFVLGSIDFLFAFYQWNAAAKAVLRFSNTCTVWTFRSSLPTS